MIDISSFVTLVGNFNSFICDVASHSSQREFGVLTIRWYIFNPSPFVMSDTIGGG